MFCRTLTTLALTLGLMLPLTARADEETAHKLKSRAKEMMIKAEALKAEGKLDAAEQAYAEAKKLLHAAEEAGVKKPVKEGEGDKPRPDKQPVKEFKEPKKEKVDAPFEKVEKTERVKPEPVKEPKKDDEDRPGKGGKDVIFEKKIEHPDKVDKRPAPEVKPIKADVPVHKYPPKDQQPARGEPGKGPGKFSEPEQKLAHLMEAAKHLREAGVNEAAEQIERMAGEVKRHIMEMRAAQEKGPGGPHAELRGVIEDLRREVAELKEQVRRMQGERR